MPCTMGNMAFFEKLKMEGGFVAYKNVSVKILTVDVPSSAWAPSACFRRGQPVTITISDPYSPLNGRSYDLVIAVDLVVQPEILSLHLERQLA